MTEKPAIRRFAALVLAAGKGTRMLSDTAKVLHPIQGRPMVLFPLAAARILGAEKIVLVIGHESDAVREAVRDDRILYAYQEEQLGTAHAVLQSRELLEEFNGTILILCGDVPLLLPLTIKELLDYHRRERSVVTVMTATPPDPAGYGRVLKDEAGRVTRIVEEKDADEAEKAIREINTGIYCVESPYLYEALSFVGDDNAQGEYYLTDLPGIAHRNDLATRAFHCADYLEAMGINTVEHLEQAEGIMARRIAGNRDSS